MEERKEYIECSCHGEGIQIWHDKEFKQTYLCMFYLGLKDKLSWWNKLRWCWQILVKGEPFNDQLILDHEKLIQLKHVLQACERENLEGHMSYVVPPSEETKKLLDDGGFSYNPRKLKSTDTAFTIWTREE